MKNNIFVLLLFASISVYSSNSKIDSLKNVLNKKEYHDSLKLKALVKLSDFYLFKNIDSSLIYALKYKEIARKISDSLNIAKGNILIANYYSMAGLYDSSIYFLSKSKEFLHGNIPQNLKDELYNNLGRNYYYLGNYVKAIEHWTESLKIREKIGDKFRISQSLSNISIIYMQMKEFEKALEYMNKSLIYQIEVNDIKGQIVSKMNLGTIYGDMQINDSAFKYTLDSYEMYNINKFTEPFLKANLLSNLGIFYSRDKQYEKALNYHNESIELSKKIGNQQFVAYNLSSIGNIYLTLNKLQFAEEILLQGLKIANDINAIVEKRNISEGLYRIYKKTRWVVIK